MSDLLFRLHLDSSVFGQEPFLTPARIRWSCIRLAALSLLFYTSLFIYDAPFGLIVLYNLSEENPCHTSPHVLLMTLKKKKAYLVNDTKYSGGQEEWFGKLPHPGRYHCPPLIHEIVVILLLLCGGRLMDFILLNRHFHFFIHF